jgi:hypothetical protein
LEAAPVPCDEFAPFADDAVCDDGAERSDGAFMTFLGVSVALFDELSERFGEASAGRGGQPARLSFADELALALRYMRTVLLP